MQGQQYLWVIECDDNHIEGTANLENVGFNSYAGQAYRFLVISNIFSSIALDRKQTFHT